MAAALASAMFGFGTGGGDGKKSVQVKVTGRPACDWESLPRPCDKPLGLFDVLSAVEGIGLPVRLRRR